MKQRNADPAAARAAAHEPNWSEEERELLTRARAARSQPVVPEAVKQRILARLRAPARPQSVSSSPSPLPTLGQLAQAMPASYREVWVAAPLAALFLVLVAVRVLGWTEPLGAWLGVGAEGSRPDGAQQAAELPLFRKAAQVLRPGSTPGRDLFGAQAFRDDRDDWQVKNWDLKSDPHGEAVHDLSGGTLCVEPKEGVPVLGAWPWLSEQETGASPAMVQGARRGPEHASKQVSLRAGQAYRLTLSAWATRPTQSRLLVAVGHAAPPYSAASGSHVELDAEPQVFGMDFVAEFDDPHVGVAFLASMTPSEQQQKGGHEPSRQKRGRVCLRDVRLTPLP